MLRTLILIGHLIRGPIYFLKVWRLFIDNNNRSIKYKINYVIRKKTFDKYRNRGRFLVFGWAGWVAYVTACEL